MEYKTKDSKERVKFKSGVEVEIKNDKPKFDLIIPEGQEYEDTMVYRLAMLMARGAKKYSDRNWEKANSKEELNRFKSSAMRHFMQWMLNVKDGEDHAAACWFNMIACEFIKEKLK